MTETMTEYLDEADDYDGDTVINNFTYDITFSKDRREVLVSCKEDDFEGIIITDEIETREDMMSWPMGKYAESISTMRQLHQLGLQECTEMIDIPMKVYTVRDVKSTLKFKGFRVSTEIDGNTYGFETGLTDDRSVNDDGERELLQAELERGIKNIEEELWQDFVRSKLTLNPEENHD